ncbi:isochorismatase family protein [Rhizobiales bacterium RZME27]|jgi:nicotinamidase-related amidase|uniref:Isochorismatase family protein n=1 Tax=Endobacterium cereale TaxID=2663029 RepID=A0A6A8AE09_9HYPH|nr:isochorismatase family protein [Endobacterium cereale]MEB2848455.1 isochorismatase family protein [Endobacterium cereale]MQY48057.1 isochorismatase family protein [Endobacterium cereale]
MSRALVVIDVQEEYFPDGGLSLHQAEEVENHLVVALGLAQKAGDRIILVRHVSPGNAGLFAASGTGVAIRPAILSAAGNAPVVTKHFADAFQETDLSSHLEGVTTLLICGMMTQNCVVFTAMSREADRFEVKVVGDLCAAPLPVVHAIALNALKSKLPVVNAGDLWP